MKNKTITNPQDINSSDKLLSRAQVADMLGLCKETIRRWEKTTQLKPIIFNSRVYRYRHAEVEAFVNRNA
jgi:predicted site-specific integrase-resolvase